MTTESKGIPEEQIDEDVKLSVRLDPADDTIILIRNSEIDIRKSGIALSKKDQDQYNESKSYEDTEGYRIIAAGPNKRNYKSGDTVILRANAELEWFNQDGQYFYITHTFGIAGRLTEKPVASMTVKKSTIFDPKMDIKNAPNIKPVIKT